MWAPGQQHHDHDGSHRPIVTDRDLKPDNMEAHP